MNRHVLPIAEPPAPPATSLDVRNQQPPFQAGEVIRPPAGAPNVLLILLDDVGFGTSSAFGGPCHMPAAEDLAAGGLRYSRFHTTALCAPTRTAMLTGRNHHSCGMGSVPESATAAPGYTGVRPRSTATIAQTLSYNGYATGAFGKMHQTPPWEQTPAGPFDRWPTREGFDKFYGFLGAETNQFTPNLIDGVTPIDPPRTEEEGYHLSEDLVDQSISWIRSVSASDPGKPWFCYLSFGACHTPIHLPREWRDRYRGEFSHGWDEQRRITLARQKELGVVPQDADLGPWTPGVPHWGELNDKERAVAERLMEAFAAFAEHTDVQVGRLIEELRSSGQLETTLVLYVLGDNGASAEGGLRGTLNEALTVNGFQDDADRMSEHLDEIGGPRSYALPPAGWAVAMDTPYQWTKQMASHYGGTRNGLIVHWPGGMHGAGEIRHQWHHCIDIASTILEVTGLPEPTLVDGIPQRPIEGVSMAYSFDDGNADERHHTQYFEMFGNRGIYHRGWTAVTAHRPPWSPPGGALPDFSEDNWELYDTTKDWTQSRDVAAEEPEKLAELQQLFLMEASRYQVLPLDDRLAERLNATLAGRISIVGDRTSQTFPTGMGRLREDAVLNLKNRSFRVVARIEADGAAVDGVIAAQGGRFGGWSLYVRNGLLTYCHNVFDLERHYVCAEKPLPVTACEVEYRFTYDGGGFGKGGTGSLWLDGEQMGSARIERTVPFFFSVDETFNVGIDRGTPVTEEYEQGLGNAYQGTVAWVRLEHEPSPDEATADDLARASLVTH